jgi:hypothetical protein
MPTGKLASESQRYLVTLVFCSSFISRELHGIRVTITVVVSLSIAANDHPIEKSNNTTDRARAKVYLGCSATRTFEIAMMATKEPVMFPRAPRSPRSPA